MVVAGIVEEGDLPPLRFDPSGGQATIFLCPTQCHDLHCYSSRNPRYSQKTYFRRTGANNNWLLPLEAILRIKLTIALVDGFRRRAMLVLFLILKLIPMKILFILVAVLLLAVGCGSRTEMPKPPAPPVSPAQQPADFSTSALHWQPVTDPEHGNLSFAYPNTVQISNMINTGDTHKPFYTDSRLVQFTKKSDVIKPPADVFESPTFVLSLWDNPQKLSTDEWYSQVTNDYTKGLQIDRDTMQFGSLQANRYLDAKAAANYDYYFTDSSSSFMFKFSINPVSLRRPLIVDDLVLFYQIFSTFKFGSR